MPGNTKQPNPVGRPPKYKTPEEMQVVIDEYFAECDNRLKEIHTKEGDSVAVCIPEPYTMSGLAYALDMSRQALLEYNKKDQFLVTIKRARARVERDVERRLLEGTVGAAGPIFNLKNNFGWKDKSEIENTVHLPTPILGGKSVHRDNSDSKDQSAPETN